MEKLDKRYLSQNFRTKFIGSEEVRVTQKSEVVYVVHLILLCAVGNASKLTDPRIPSPLAESNFEQTAGICVRRTLMSFCSM